MNDAIMVYINRAPAAISGQRGHDTTLRVARTLCNGFALSRDQVLQWLRIYNRRLSKRWFERELAHKADSVERGKYDKPRGWMPNKCQAHIWKRISIRPPVIGGGDPKITEKYILAKDATDISHTSRMQVRAHAQTSGVSEKSVANMADSPRTEDSEARRIAVELVKLHRDGAIKGTHDPDALERTRAAT
jgi:hypothetical protein